MIIFKIVSLFETPAALTDFRPLTHITHKTQILNLFSRILFLNSIAQGRRVSFLLAVAK